MKLENHFDHDVFNKKNNVHMNIDQTLVISIGCSSIRLIVSNNSESTLLFMMEVSSIVLFVWIIVVKGIGFFKKNRIHTHKIM